MPVYSCKRIRTTLLASDKAVTTTERGRLLEGLVAYLFDRCPGVRQVSNNSLSSAGSSEIDVSFWNNKLSGSLDFLPNILIGECKNTGVRVGSPEIRVFLSKLIEMRLDHGILVAAQGITGDPDSLRAAHDVVRTAFIQSGIRIIVITRTEIEALSSTDGLILLLQNKVLLLTMQSTSFR